MDNKRKRVVAVILVVCCCAAIVSTTLGFETFVPIRVHITTTESNFKVYLTQADETGTSGEFEEIQLSKSNSYVFMGDSQKSYTSNFWVFVKVDVGEALFNVFAIPRRSLIQRPDVCIVYLTIKRTISGDLYIDVDDVILHSHSIVADFSFEEL